MRKSVSISVMLLVISLIVVPSNVEGQSVGNTFPTEILPEYTISEPVRITSNEDFIKQNYTGSGTQNDPYRIQGLNISNTPISIQISDTNAWFVINNCYLRSNITSGATVYLNNVTNGRIQDSIVGGEMIGIYLESSQDCIIRRNIVRGLVVGILFQNSIDCIIRDNFIHSCEVGVRINDSFSCGIHDNRIYSNTNAGIVLTRLSQGNSVFNNYIAFNIASGQTQLDENNAKDDGLLNSWDRNNWSDYLINQTYRIPGLAGSMDESAGGLVRSSQPSVAGSSNLVFIIGSLGHIVKWNTSHLFPVSYEIHLNNELIKHGWWEQYQFSFNASILPIGVYNLTLTVFDGTGNHTTDPVFISVLEDIFSDLGTEYVILASGLSAIFVLFALYAIKRMRFQ